MPKTVSVKDMPRPTHNVDNLVPKPLKYPAIIHYLEDLLKDKNRRAWEVAVYTVDDGVTAKNRESISNSLRSAARKLELKIAIVWQPTECALYVRYDGEYVPMTKEELAVRRIQRVSRAETRRIRNSR